MKILILGAAGQIAKLLTKDLLDQTPHHLVLFARGATKRLKNMPESRISLIDGDFEDAEALSRAMDDVDLIYINDMGNSRGLTQVAKYMKEKNISRIIGASILGIYDEVPGAFGAWNQHMVGRARIKQQTDNAAILENDDFDYTILRLTWLYNQKNNRSYMITLKGTPFEGAQVTREAVSQLITDIIQEPSNIFIKASLGVSEPNTNWDKPSFY